MKLKIASLLIVSMFFVSCSSKQKAATPATKTAAKNEAGKKADAKSTKPTAAPTKTAATAAAGSVVCKSGSDTRSLEVVAKDGGCELSYTKFDQTTTPATSGSGTAHCEAVKEKIKGNLENSGFKCE